MIGLTLAEGKHLLAALQVHLVQAQAEDHCRHRQRCLRCGPSKISAPGGWCHCSAPWRSAHRVYPVSVCGDQPTDAQSGWRDHARPMHTGVRADRRKDGIALTLSPGVDAAGGVSATR
jgi:hypothetical protein